LPLIFLSILFPNFHQSEEWKYQLLAFNGEIQGIRDFDEPCVVGTGIEIRFQKASCAAKKRNLETGQHLFIIVWRSRVGVHSFSTNWSDG